MLFEGKKTFKDFTESQESIATNILSVRLKMLEKFGIVEKAKLPTNKKTNIYTLTDKGLSLTPVLIELVLWSKYNIQEFNPDLNLDHDLEKVEKNKKKACQTIVEKYKEFKRSILSQ
ncbi:winged helix-turn-helix transcriptional regulator [Fulvitalea axinellae]